MVFFILRYLIIARTLVRMYILDVIPLSQLLPQDHLSYFSAKDVSVGALVSVPLRNKEVLALVVAKKSALEMKSLLRNASFQMRNISQIHQNQVFSPAFLTMVHEIADIYLCNVSAVIQSMCPKAIITHASDITIPNQLPQATEISPELCILQQKHDDRIRYYKTRAREVLGKKQSLIIICPTVIEAQNIYTAVTKGIEERSYLVHGKLRSGTLVSLVQNLYASPEGAIIIGTYSALALFPADISEYIIHQSSSPYYQKEVTKPHLDIRKVVERLAHHMRSRCTYADTMVDIQSWHRLNVGQMNAIEPSSLKIFDTKKLTLLRYSVGTTEQSEADRIKELRHDKQGFHPLHHESYAAIQEAVRKQEKIFVYAPKKGQAPHMVCAECGNLAVSTHSGQPFSLFIQRNQATQQQEPVYVCVKTGEKVPAFDRCQFCSGVSLVRMGIGTAQLADMLATDFPHAQVVCYDALHMKTTKARNEFLKHYQGNAPLIIVGTSKAVFEIEKVDVSVVTSFAPVLASMSYDSEEQVLYLLTTILEKTRGTTYLQDRKDLLSHVEVLETGMLQNFIQKELAERKQYHLPPFQTLVEIIIPIKKNTLKRSYYQYEKIFKSFDPSISVSPGATKQEANITVYIKFDTHNWVVSKPYAMLRALLSELNAHQTVYIHQ